MCYIQLQKITSFGFIAILEYKELCIETPFQRGLSCQLLSQGFISIRIDATVHTNKVLP